MPTYTREVNCSHNLRASLDEDGKFTLRARSRVAYAPDLNPEAYVGAEIEVPADLAADVRDAMEAAMNAVNEKLAAKVDQAAAGALEHAVKQGDFDDAGHVLRLHKVAGIEPTHRSPVVMQKIARMLEGKKE